VSQVREKLAELRADAATHFWAFALDQVVNEAGTGGIESVFCVWCLRAGYRSWIMKDGQRSYNTPYCTTGACSRRHPRSNVVHWVVFACLTILVIAVGRWEHVHANRDAFWLAMLCYCLMVFLYFDTSVLRRVRREGFRRERVGEVHATQRTSRS
jgi:hypothetical protein